MSVVPGSCFLKKDRLLQHAFFSSKEEEHLEIQKLKKKKVKNISFTEDFYIDKTEAGLK